MLKFAIIRPVYEKDGRGIVKLVGFTPLIEGEDGDIEREIASRVRRILGPKRSYTGKEIDRAIATAFENYKKDFKEQTIKLK
jgi:hypothetical protein